VEPFERRTLSVSEAARILGISRAHAYDCVRTGDLPSIALGRRVVVPRQALEELLARGSSGESASHG
jgi:excisionase family DNA binding protein